MTRHFGRNALLATVLVLAGAPALAQDSASEARIRKLEAEVRALQGKVFPGGDGKFFPAQVQPATAGAASGGTPATTPVTDLLARMDAVEATLARLTAQTEQNGNRLTQLEAKLAATAAAPAVGAVTEGNLAAMTGGASAPKPAAAGPARTPTPAATVAKPAPKPAAPSAQRLAAVRAVEKPQTADPADDEYSYGFRLWEAKLYPEAEQQLKLFLDKYPRHTRVSFARNLMGRALLDEGKPLDAAKWFFDNHQSDPKGARAPDSLLFLAEAMKRNKDTKRACVAIAQFADDYPAEAAARLKAQYDATRNGLTCN